MELEDDKTLVSSIGVPSIII